MLNALAFGRRPITLLRLLVLRKVRCLEICSSAARYRMSEMLIASAIA
jgi:hypothetical protein